jgi:hypothetical protein
VLLVVPVLIPPFAYLVAAFGAGMGAGDAFAAMVSQIGGRPALFTPVILGLAPLLLHAGVLAVLKRRDPQGRWLPLASWFGLAPSLALLLWANLEVWPLHLPGRTFPGFPHGLELVIVPLFFVPVALVGGTVLGALVARAGHRRGAPPSPDRTGT